MSQQGKSRKPLIVGVIAAVVILAVLLAVLLTQCIGGRTNTDSTTESTSNGVPTYQIYWNLDKAEYAGKSEAGMSSREPDADGMYSVRFFLDGETVTLRVADRRLINEIDAYDVMGLEFDENGVVVGVLNLDEMPLEKVGWQFYVQSWAKNMIKVNSSVALNGMEIMLEGVDFNRIWDMTGTTGEVGCVTELIEKDRVMVIQNLAGQITHIFIFEGPGYMETHEAYCEHCKEEVTWSHWTKTDTIPLDSGHYQLTCDIQLKGQNSIHEEAKLCLDLNGYRIDGKENARATSMHNPAITFAVMDTSEEQTGVIASHGTSTQGMTIWARYGALYLYSGTLDASDSVSTGSGTAIAVPAGSFLYMYGGRIIGGTAKYLYNESTGKYVNGMGGAISVAGKFVMNGGIIENGRAQAYVYTKNGDPVYERGFGGNVALNNATFEMNGGIIRNGRADSQGGNLYVSGTSEVNMNGGTISGGVITSKKNGGNVCLSGVKLVFNMNGGTITGGTSRNAGGALYCNGTLNMRGGIITGGKVLDYATGKEKTTAANANIFLVNGTLNMTGGKITGDINVYKSQEVKIQGDAQITQGNVRGIVLQGTNVIKIAGKLTGEEPIPVYVSVAPTADTPKQFAEGSGDYTVSEEDKAMFTSSQNHKLVLKGGKAYMYLASATITSDCVCGMPNGKHVQYIVDGETRGCLGIDLTWNKWESTTTLPTAAGNYYLDADVNLSAQTTISADVKIDLKGKTITATASIGGKPAVILDGSGAKLTITNSDPENGGLLNSNNYTMFAIKNSAKMSLWHTDVNMTSASIAHGGLISLNTSGELNVFAGTVIRNGKTGANGTAKQNGGNIKVYSSGILNLYDGIIKDGRAYNQGGNINLEGVLNMYGGKITGGASYTDTSAKSNKDHGNILANGASAQLNLYGGQLDGDVNLYGSAADNCPSITLKGSIVVNKGAVQGLPVQHRDTTVLKVAGALTGSVNVTYKGSATISETNSVAFAESSGYTLTEADAAKFESSQNYAVVRNGNNLYMKVINLTMGYARANITPSYSVPLGGYGNSSQRMSTSVLDNQYTTAIAINDGENTVIIIESDLQASVATVFNNVRQQVSQQTGIPVDNIMSAVDHVHSAPDLWNTAESFITQYTTELTNAMVSNAVAAVQDMKAVNIYVGSTQVTGANFVRHYLRQDGNVSGPNFGQQYTSPIVGHTHDADNELQVVKFDRDGGDDIVLVNWQAHPQKATSSTKTEITSDTVGAMRDYVEANSSYKFFYVLGASGDVASTSSITSENVHADYKAYGNAMGQQIVTILGGTMTQVKDGQIKTLKSTYTATVDKTENDKVEQARIIYNQWLQDNDTEAAVTAGAQYGINSPYHAKAIIQKHNLAATQNIEVNAFAIGKLGFVFAPYEMFCENGAYIKANSPFEKTIVCTMANDTYNYISAADGFDYNCYEANTCRFVKGTGEALAEKYVSMLNELGG